MEVLATKAFPCPAISVEAVAEVPGADAFQFTVTVPPQAAHQVLEALSGSAWGLDALAEQLAAMHGHLASGGFLPAVAFAAIAARLGPQVRMVKDTGYFCTIGEHVWLAPDAGLCLMSGQGRYMGTGVPMALGAALTDPERPTVAVLGDGGIGMYIGEMRLAVEHRLPLLVVLMSDGRFGSIATRALKDGLTLAPLTMSAPSWVKVMEGIGVPSVVADTPQALDAALDAWDHRAGPGYIEIVFAPEPYEQMVAGIR
jgi:thiamine pyrophosphate-dependent acetolactate synthase large subunit-like protein